MKAFTILGSIFGFLTGVGFGLLNNTSWPTMLWHASAAALLMALLARWWSRMWLLGLRDSAEQRRRARAVLPANIKSSSKV